MSRNLCLKALSLTVVLVFGSVLQPWSQAQEEGDYFYVGDEKIPLEVSQRYQALKLKPGAPVDRMSVILEGVKTAGVGQVEPSPILEHYGVTLIRIESGVGPASFTSEIERLGGVAQFADVAPVYAVDGADQVLTNEFIVQFEQSATDAQIEQAIEAKGGEIVEKHGKAKKRFIVTFPEKSPREALAVSNQLHQEALVRFSEPNFLMVIPARPRLPEGVDASGPSEDPAAQDPNPNLPSPDDTYFPKQYYLENDGSAGKKDADIDALGAWGIQKGTETTIVAILDEGVDTSHEDLAPKIVTPYDATDGDNDQEPKAWDGHGTACAGIAASMTDNARGVSSPGWKVKIMPVRIAYSNYSGGPWITTTGKIADGIDTAVARGADVLSNSWGGGGPSNAIYTAFQDAAAANVTLVIAAGNDSGPVSYPAKWSSSLPIIAVSATNEWDEFKTKTSSDGETWWGSNFGPEVSVSAPGVHIWTTDISGSKGYNKDPNGHYYSSFNGTSSATPIVAGVAALVLSKDPNLTPDQVRTRLQSTADDLGTGGPDPQFGHGRVNACRALGGTEKDCEGLEAPPNGSALSPVTVAVLLAGMLLLGRRRSSRRVARG